jgi:hypothetical protein
MKRTNILLVSVLTLFFGCNSTEYLDYTDTQVPIKKADTQFSAIGGEKEIVVDLSDKYTVVSDKEWCKTTIKDKTVTVNVEPNMTLSGRTALLTIESGTRQSVVSITQTSAVIKLENYVYDVFEEKDTVVVKYECDFPVRAGELPEWISSSLDRQKQEITFIVEAGTYSRTAIIPLYVDGENDVVLTVKEISIRQNLLTYDDFIGPYTMTYSKSIDGSYQDSLNVFIIGDVSGKSYFLKGLLADDDIGSILINYNDLTGALSFTGCKIVPARNSDTPDVWWAPYQVRGSSLYVTPTNAYGMKSTDHNIAGRLSFVLEDDGLDPGYTTIGFILRKYIGSSNQGDVSGKDGQSRYFYPVFRKK